MSDGMSGFIVGILFGILISMIAAEISIRSRKHREKYAWCDCGDSRISGTHSAAKCGPPEWRY